MNPMQLFGCRKSFTVNEPDPTYTVVYLGNVPTGIARGDGCVDRPLGVIWRSYCERKKDYMSMRLVVTNSGLKVTTEKQGLTEYWSHRITFCAVSEKHPRVFCWIYKHEGRRLRPELRCHAALFKRQSQANLVMRSLQERLVLALNDYKRDKIVRQKLRLSCSVAGLPTAVPLRRQLLYTGGQNFRPPMDRSKSAPKLYSIEECIEEEQQMTPAAQLTSALLDSLAEKQQSDEEVVEEEEEESTTDSLFEEPSSSSLTDESDCGLDEELRKRLRLRPDSSGSEADTISDESGYIDEDDRPDAVVAPSNSALRAIESTAL
ncbi:Protein FAM43A [Trichinella pseudospiralis]|uniref:Protein FAM43A n=1 Tax=Trichinella pseudospiralis TaxID=6337 RepID=A0A0V1JNJ9_TRIPS|nr:Protein FAM43A [Trichinella pseudospiralis]KRZ36547.1 Protein FAM43A [Trichinella pseudospiralis]